MMLSLDHADASLGIRPEQYTIVGRHLLDAVATVLGDAVTPAPYRPYRVVEKRTEAEDVFSLVLAPADDGEVPTRRPGQYVTIAVTLPDGLRQPRQYTLSRATENSIQITVRRVRSEDITPDGAVSTFLSNGISVGQELEVSAPFGDVVMEDGEDPLVLVTAGIGITPAAAMIDHLATVRPDRHVLAVHADRSPHTHALRRQTAEAGRLMPGFHQITWYEDPGSEPLNENVRQGRVDVAAIPLPPKARVFMCGPIPFMREVRRGLLAAGVSDERIHYEVFGPDLWLR